MRCERVLLGVYGGVVFWDWDWDWVSESIAATLVQVFGRRKKGGRRIAVYLYHCITITFRSNTSHLEIIHVSHLVSTVNCIPSSYDHIIISQPHLSDRREG